MERQEGRGRPSTSYTGDETMYALAHQLSELARSLHEETDTRATLTAITEAAVVTVPGAKHAGLMVVRNRRHVETRAATGELVSLADQAQFETGEGPCLDAVWEHRTIRLPDMANEPRWPDFAVRAARLGIGSMLSFQLYVQRDNLGALNLFAEEPDAFDNESENVGLLFAAHAAVAMSGAQQQDQLSHAVAVRDLIGQAKGILMERHRLTADQAFTLLVRASQSTNTKLVDVARHLTDTGEISSDESRG